LAVEVNENEDIISRSATITVYNDNDSKTITVN
jgi:hypothetical protein